MTLRTSPRGRRRLSLELQRVGRVLLVAGTTGDVAVSASQLQVTVMPWRAHVREARLHVAIGASPLHPALVHVFVARRAVAREACEALRPLGQHLRVGVFVASRTSELAVLAKELEADQHMVEARPIRDTGQGEAAAVHHREVLAMVLAMTACALRGGLDAVATLDSAVEAVPVFDLLRDVLVAFEARLRHRTEESTMTLRTAVPGGELGQAGVHGGERTWRRLVEPQARDADDRDDREERQEDRRLVASHAAPLNAPRRRARGRCAEPARARGGRRPNDAAIATCS